MQCLYDSTTKVKSCACPSGMILEADGLHCTSKFTNESHFGRTDIVEFDLFN